MTASETLGDVVVEDTSTMRGRMRGACGVSCPGHGSIASSQWQVNPG